MSEGKVREIVHEELNSEAASQQAAISFKTKINISCQADPQLISQQLHQQIESCLKEHSVGYQTF